VCVAGKQRGRAGVSADMQQPHAHTPSQHPMGSSRPRAPAPHRRRDVGAAPCCDAALCCLCKGWRRGAVVDDDAARQRTRAGLIACCCQQLLQHRLARAVVYEHDTDDAAAARHVGHAVCQLAAQPRVARQRQRARARAVVHEQRGAHAWQLLGPQQPLHVGCHACAPPRGARRGA
jgi:hypothetical protein